MTPQVVTDKHGLGWIQIDEHRVIGFHDGKLTTVKAPTVLFTEPKVPLKTVASHFLASSCNHPFDQDTIEVLKKMVTAYVMPQYTPQVLLASTLGPAKAAKFFQFWAPVNIQENVEMATTKTEKKPAPKAKAEKKPAAPKSAKEPKAKRPGIGAFCLDLIAKGKTNDEILEAVQKQFPDAKTSKGCIAFYRNKAKQ